MNILQNASCGNDKSNDILIEVEKGEGININLQSSVEKRFSRQIKQTIKDVIMQMGVENITINAKDNGALDYAIIARTKQAILKATNSKQYDWSK